ncbi:MAG: PD-(D/E)XK nuclease domain-containing protein, partial [Acidobacteria bacterium]|nr:PD-(D/E)XK nuclease domain-containing protein [Acidobacteriota bacterium]
ALFASIPYEWHTRNDIARYEGYYASVFYSCFAALGLDVTVEDSSSHGRLDMAVRFHGNVYLFEFKMLDGSAGGRPSSPDEAAEEPPASGRSGGRAMAQWKRRGYADKYRHLDQPIHLIAVEVDRETRNLASWEVERA